MWKRALMAVLGLAFLGLAGAQAQQAPTLTIWADEVRAPVLQQVATTFTNETGVNVQIELVPFGDIRPKFITSGPTGTPDLIIGPHDWVGELVANGLLEPLALGRLREDFVESALEGFTVGGRLYGLPYATEAIALIYNKDLVPTPPATFDELVSIAKRLTDPEKGQYGFLHNVWGPDPYHSFPYVTAYGGYIFGKDAQGRLNPCDVGLERGAPAYQLLLSLTDQGLVPRATGYGEMASTFEAGKAGMIVTGPWQIKSIRDKGINVGVAKLPLIEGRVPRPFVGAQGFMVNSSGANKPAALTFLFNFIATTGTMVDLFRRDPRPPAFKPALDDSAVRADPTLAVFVASVADGIPMPNIPQMSAVWGAWSDAITQIADKQATPQQALADAVTRIKASLQCPP